MVGSFKLTKTNSIAVVWEDRRIEYRVIPEKFIGKSSNGAIRRYIREMMSEVRNDGVRPSQIMIC